MTTHLVTFATDDMRRSLAVCATSAMRYGIDDPHAFASYILPLDMQKRCEGQRGYGWWQWKPQIIKIVMDACVDGDIVIYADAGIEFIDNVKHIIDRMDSDVWLFGNMFSHLHWCKADTLNAVSPGVEWDVEDKQVQASVVFFRVSEWSRKFVAEWLSYCLQPHLIDDSPSVAPNHEEFREHRHDQSILTCLAYKYGIPLHWWPAVYNQFTGPTFTYEKGEYVDTYPPLFHHHRLRNHEYESLHVLA